MPTHSTYSSSVDIATGAVLSYGFDVEAEKKDPFYTEEAKEVDRKEELDRINNLL